MLSRDLYLQLEENIRLIALSGDWVKAMDDWLVDSSVIQISVSTVGTTQKRGPNGKRQRKQSGMSDFTANGCHDKSFIWWRGGQVLKSVFHKAILSRSMAKRAARQGNFMHYQNLLIVIVKGMGKCQFMISPH